MKLFGGEAIKAKANLKQVSAESKVNSSDEHADISIKNDSSANEETQLA